MKSITFMTLNQIFVCVHSCVLGFVSESHRNQHEKTLMRLSSHDIMCLDHLGDKVKLFNGARELHPGADSIKTQSRLISISLLRGTPCPG